MTYIPYPQGERLEGYPAYPHRKPKRRWRPTAKSYEQANETIRRTQAMLDTCPEPYQQSDEYVCGRCQLRWDTHEDRPPCPRI